MIPWDMTVKKVNGNTAVRLKLTISMGNSPMFQNFLNL